MRRLRARLIRLRFDRRIAREVRPDRFGAYGSRSVVHPPLHVGDRRGVTIGSGSYVLAGSRIEFALPRGAARVAIGDRTYLGRDLTILCGAGVVIGNDVMGSDRLYIADLEHRPTGPGPVPGRTLGPARPVRIEDGVFLGTGAMILPGVTVGARSLVAAGAVVTRDVPANAVVAGNPARVVRRFDPQRGDWVPGDRDQGVGVA